MLRRLKLGLFAAVGVLALALPSAGPAKAPRKLIYGFPKPDLRVAGKPPDRRFGTSLAIRAFLCPFLCLYSPPRPPSKARTRALVLGKVRARELRAPLDRLCVARAVPLRSICRPGSVPAHASPAWVKRRPRSGSVARPARPTPSSPGSAACRSAERNQWSSTKAGGGRRRAGTLGVRAVAHAHRSAAHRAAGAPVAPDRAASRASEERLIEAVLRRRPCPWTDGAGARY